MKKIKTLLICCILCFCSQASADPSIAGSAANGDATLLAAYEIPTDHRREFEANARAAAARATDASDDMWLMYEELAIEGDAVSIAYFTVHFPDNLNELTEPTSATYGLTATAGLYRVRAELTRQVPAWCSTTEVDATMLEYAFVDYLWLKPNALEAVGQILAERGKILRSVYGTGSDGNSATEGFVSMVAPFQVMLVLFSSKSSLTLATKQLRRDLKSHGLVNDWDSLEADLTSFVTKHSSRSGRFRPRLSANY